MMFPVDQYDRKIEGELRDARFVDVTANKYFYFLALLLLLFRYGYID